MPLGRICVVARMMSADPGKSRTRSVYFDVSQSYVVYGVRSENTEEVTRFANFFVRYINFDVFKRCVKQSARDKNAVRADCFNVGKLDIFNRSAFDRAEQSAAVHLSARYGVISSVERSRKTSACVCPLHTVCSVSGGGVEIVSEYEVFARIKFIFDTLVFVLTLNFIVYAIYEVGKIRNAFRYKRYGNLNRMV